MMRTLLAASALLAGASFATAAVAQDYEPLEGDPEVINFGIISTESTQNLRRQWEPFLEDMSEALGMPVEGFYASDYTGVIEAMRFGQVTVAWFGNNSAIAAVDMANGEVFARQVKEDGTEGYYSHILVHADSDMQTLEDLLARCGEGLDFGMGDPQSTSGFVVPSYYVFAQNDIDPQDCFANVRNSNHETNLMAVANEQVDAAANNSEQVARSEANAPDAAANVRPIWTSPLIPSDPLVFRADLSRELKNSIRAFFLSYGRVGDDVEEELEVLAGMTDGLGPFTDSSNAQLYPIRELRLFRERTELMNDDRMDAAERDRRIEEIDEELATLRILQANR
jgi:phosphonate transport system substrate-binding protein